MKTFFVDGSSEMVKGGIGNILNRNYIYFTFTHISKSMI